MPIIKSENFDSYVNGSLMPANDPAWKVDSNMVYKVDNARSFSAPNSMKLNPLAGAGWVKGYLSVNFGTETTVEQRVNCLTTTDHLFIITQSTDAPYDGTKFISGVSFYQGVIWYLDISGWHNTGIPHSAGIWHKAKTVHNWAAKTYDFYLDDVKIISAVAFIDNLATTCLSVHYQCLANDTFWIDDVQIGTPTGGFVISKVAVHDATWRLRMVSNVYVHTNGTIYVMFGKAKTETALDGTIHFVESTDNGLTWSAEALLISDPSYRVCEPQLIRSNSGRIFMIWVVWQSGSNVDVWVKYNDDNLLGGLAAASWSTPAKIGLPPVGTAMAVDRKGIVLPATDANHPNRIIIPTFWVDTSTGGTYHAGFWVSDDNGVTWVRKGDIYVVGGGGTSTAEPTIIRYASGQLEAFFRNRVVPPNKHYRSVSNDGGDTWSVPVASQFQCPNTVEGPCYVTMLSNGQQAFVWNNSLADRYPLDVTCSNDKLVTNTTPLTLRTGKRCSYPALIDLNPTNDVVMIFYTYNNLPTSDSDIEMARGVLSDLPLAPGLALIIKDTIIKNTVVEAI